MRGGSCTNFMTHLGNHIVLILAYPTNQRTHKSAQIKRRKSNSPPDKGVAMKGAIASSLEKKM